MTMSHLGGVRALLAILAVACTLGSSSDALAQYAPVVRNMSVEERLSRLERMMESQTLVNMLRRLDALEQEVRDLRGQVELQAHTLDSMRRRQREMYLDMERPPATPGSERAVPDLGPMEPESAGRPSAETPALVPPPPEAGEAGEQADYESAFNLLKEGRYDEAIDAFRAFLQRYPDSHYSPAAQYWIGEAYYVTRRFREALPELQEVIDRYPGTDKVPDALLKTGYIYYEQGRYAEARRVLEDLRARFPDSNAANLAAQRLQKMRKEGR